MGPRSRVTAVLIIRVWLEEHETAPLRAVITQAHDVGADEPPDPVTVSSKQQVIDTVAAWLGRVFPDSL